EALDASHKSRSLEVQHIYSLPRVKIQSGISVADLDETLEATSNVPGLGTFVVTNTAEDRQLGAYSYAHFSPTATLTVTAGIGIDKVDAAVETDGLNPKFGLIWKPTPRTTLRAAAFETLFTSLTTSAYNTQPRLEPVQVAGFAQILFGSTSDNDTVRGIGIEQELSTHLFVGWEAQIRDTRRRVPNVFFPPFDPIELT